MRNLLNRFLPGQASRDAADGLIARGNQAEKEGGLREACSLYREAVNAAPGYARAQLNLGIGLEAAGDAEAALEAYKAAVSLDGQDAAAAYNLGRLLAARGDPARAEALLRSALESKPAFPEALVALSNVHDTLGDLDAAESAIRKALEQRPDYAGAWLNLGEILVRKERLPDAEAALRRAVDIDPRYADAWQLLGDVLLRLERPQDAEPALRQAIAINPAAVPAYRFLGLALRKLLRGPEALEAFAAARKLAPEDFASDPMELYTLASSDSISEEELFARHKTFGERLEKAVPARFEPLANTPEPGRRLRIGYVSGDFRAHPVTLFMIPVLQRHDRSAYETHCYSVTTAKDSFTPKVLAMGDAWRDCASMSGPEMADVIHRDGIDVLVDLSGYTGIPCLNVFAQRPAPVQVTWLGYLNSTGLTRIQYRLCDAYTDPPGMTERQHTETLVRLPHSQWCYRPWVSIGHAAEPPMRRNGFVTFGSFNDPLKISGSTRRLWCEVLARVPESRMIVVGIPEGQARERLLEDFRAAGISDSRIRTVKRVGVAEYFGWLDSVDIALDTTPYSGGTTTCDALWAGVPVVTAPGTRPFSRSASSILATVGLSEWIGSNPQDYVSIAARFAREEGTLVELRRSLRGTMQRSPLMDEARFVRDLESAYRSMWRAWCESAAR